MSATLAKAVLSISVDLELAFDSTSIGQRSSHQAAADRLLDAFSSYQVPATWAMSDPATSPTVARIVSRREGHEIALLGDPSWVGPSVARAEFERELARRIVVAAGSDVSICTLVVDIEHLGEHCQAAVRQGVVAVRHLAPEADRKRHRLQPGTLHFGLWSFPVRCTLPGSGRLLPGGGGGRAVRAAVDRAIVERGLVPLAIDAGHLASRGYAAYRALERVLAHAERRCRQGVLDISTMQAITAGLSLRYESAPSRSILCPAA